MRGERLRTLMQADRVIVNVGISFHSAALVEILGYAGVDDVYLDAEHGSINEFQCEDMVRAADLLDKPVIIRVPKNEPHVILRYLDIGTSGIIVPHVASREDAERAVKAIKYGPEGTRSFAGNRAGGYGAQESATDYIARANRETVVIGLFEDIHGLASVPDILAVEGLDALIVGPNDLAFSMGYPAQPWHPEVQKVVDQVIVACRRAGIPTGLPANDFEQARRHVERGCRMITVNASALLMGAVKQFMSQIRE
ncbi:MAG: HpcH/HpaI aldolase family protein [Chloroflexota bacterium]